MGLGFTRQFIVGPRRNDTDETYSLTGPESPSLGSDSTVKGQNPGYEDSVSSLLGLKDEEVEHREMEIRVKIKREF